MSEETTGFLTFYGSVENRGHATLAEYDELKMINDSQRNSIATLETKLRVANDWGAKLNYAVVEKDAEIERLQSIIDNATIKTCSCEAYKTVIAEKDAEVERLRDYQTRTMFTEAENKRMREALECLVDCVEMGGYGKAYAMDIAKQALSQGGKEKAR